MTQLTAPIRLALDVGPTRSIDASPAAKRCATYRIGPVGVRFHCRDASMAKAYCELNVAYATNPPGDADEACFDVRVSRRRSRRTGLRHFHIESNVEDRFTVRRMDRVLPHVECSINLCIARLMPRYLLLHASTVTRHGVAAIFPGGPGFGKSTLAAALTARGWRYGSDEFAMIDPVNGAVDPYPKALSIKSGSVRILAAQGVPVDRAPRFDSRDKGAIRLLPPHLIRRDCVASRAAARMIVLPALTPKASPSFARISRGEAVFEMVRRCFNTLRFRDRAIDVLERLTRGAACYRLTVGDLGRTCELIEREFDSIC
jgi:HprK-related kinase A